MSLTNPTMSTIKIRMEKFKVLLDINISPESNKDKREYPTKYIKSSTSVEIKNLEMGKL